MTVLAENLYVYSKTDQLINWLSRHWLLTLSIIMGIYVLVPFLAPIFMSVGLIVPGKVIYWVYSFLCHQLPERSYFLLGPRISYTITEIQPVWQNTDNVAILRQFVGNPEMGWKVAWSDRMVSMFTSLWVFGILWGLFKKKIKPLPWWGLILFLLPMGIDGLTHFFSDLAGLGQGFRDSNAWLAVLTYRTFPTPFYAGDAWGSFNAWMRLITGLLFGLGIVWFGFPFLDDAFKNSAEIVEYKQKRRILLVKEKEHLLKISSVGLYTSDCSNGVKEYLEEGKYDNQ
jgi:uncharacterized membrane protein